MISLSSLAIYFTKDVTVTGKPPRNTMMYNAATGVGGIKIITNYSCGKVCPSTVSNPHLQKMLRSLNSYVKHKFG